MLNPVLTNLSLVSLGAADMGDFINIVHNIRHEQKHVLERGDTANDKVGLKPIGY